MSIVIKHSTHGNPTEVNGIASCSPGIWKNNNKFFIVFAAPMWCPSSIKNPNQGFWENVLTQSNDKKSYMPCFDITMNHLSLSERIFTKCVGETISFHCPE